MYASFFFSHSHLPLSCVPPTHFPLLQDLWQTDHLPLLLLFLLLLGIFLLPRPCGSRSAAIVRLLMIWNKETTMTRYIKCSGCSFLVYKPPRKVLCTCALWGMLLLSFNELLKYWGVQKSLYRDVWAPLSWARLVVRKESEKRPPKRDVPGRCLSPCVTVPLSSGDRGDVPLCVRRACVDWFWCDLFVKRLHKYSCSTSCHPKQNDILEIFDSCVL